MRRYSRGQWCYQRWQCTDCHRSFGRHTLRKWRMWRHEREQMARRCYWFAANDGGMTRMRSILAARRPELLKTFDAILSGNLSAGVDQ